MKRTSFARVNCPVARSLERIGDWWTVLVLRDVFYGLHRFDELSESLGIASNMLTKRLRALVKGGLLERRPYQTKPVRYEYVLTRVGLDFHPVLVALLAWGNRHFAPAGGPSVEIARSSGGRVRPVLSDAATGERIAGEGFRLVAGPGADRATRERLAARGHLPFSRRCPARAELAADGLDLHAHLRTAPLRLHDAGIITPSPRGRPLCGGEVGAQLLRVATRAVGGSARLGKKPLIAGVAAVYESTRHEFGQGYAVFRPARRLA